MSNMDELLINAHLEERRPMNLPWNLNEERRSKASCTRTANEVDATASYFNSNKNDCIHLNKPNIEDSSDDSEKCDNAKSGHCDNETNILFCNTDITFTVRKTTNPELVVRDKCRNQTHGYKPSFSEDRMSNNVKRSVLPSYTNLERKETCNHLATLTGTKIKNIQNKPRKSPKSSVKVSRKMVQESKLGYSLSLLSGKNNSESIDYTSKSSNCLLTKNNKNEYELGNTVFKKNEQNKHKEDATSVDKNHECTELEEPRVNNRRSSSRDKITKSEIDNKLDELLNVTEEALECQNLKGKTQRETCTTDKYARVNKQVRETDKDEMEIIPRVTPMNHTLNFRYDRSQTKTSHRYMSGKDNATKETTATRRKYEKKTRDVSNPETSKHYKKEGGDENSDKCEMDTCDEYSELLNKHNQKNYNRESGEDKEEILKFTCQMMEIKQPKLMSKRKRSQNTEVSDTTDRRREINNKTCDNNDIIDYAKVDELNKKSEDLFRKIIRDRKNKRKVNKIVIIAEPDCVRKRIQKKEKIKNNEQIKLVARDVTEYKPAVIHEIKKDGEDDVFDISPAKDRDTLTDSESENTDPPEPNNATDVGHDIRLQNNVSLHKMYMPNASKSYTIIKHDIEPTIADTNTVVRSKSIRFANKKTLKKQMVVTKISPNDGVKQSIKEENRDTQNIVISQDDKMSDIRLEEQEIPRKDNRTDKGKESTKMAEQVSEGDDTKSNDKLVEASKRGVQETLIKEWEWDDIMYDSDTDSYSSNYSSEYDYVRRSLTTASRELDFPRPASNRTFILYNKDENGGVSSSSDEVLSVKNDVKIDTLDREDKKEGKPGKLQRVFRWFMCCVRPNTDN